MTADDPPPLGANKPVLREWAKTRRAAAFPPNVLADVSARLCDRVRVLPEWQAARHVLLYLAMPGEISVEPLMEGSGGASDKKQFYVPRCGPKRRLVIHPYTPGHTPMVSGVWGLREPNPACVPFAPPSVLDLVIVPALLLTPGGDRLGYGGGYYDRFLPHLAPSCVTIGVLPSALLVPDLPLDEWDVPLHLVVSE